MPDRMSNDSSPNGECVYNVQLRDKAEKPKETAFQRISSQVETREEPLYIREDETPLQLISLVEEMRKQE